MSFCLDDIIAVGAVKLLEELAGDGLGHALGKSVAPAAPDLLLGAQLLQWLGSRCGFQKLMSLDAELSREISLMSGTRGVSWPAVYQANTTSARAKTSRALLCFRLEAATALTFSRAACTCTSLFVENVRHTSSVLLGRGWL